MSEAPATITVITENDILLTPARNIADLIETYVPGAISDLEQWGLSDIQRIEVVRGLRSVTYGLVPLAVLLTSLRTVRRRHLGLI